MTKLSARQTALAHALRFAYELNDDPSLSGAPCRAAFRTADRIAEVLGYSTDRFGSLDLYPEISDRAILELALGGDVPADVPTKVRDRVIEELETRHELGRLARGKDVADIVPHPIPALPSECKAEPGRLAEMLLGLVATEVEWRKIEDTVEVAEELETCRSYADVLRWIDWSGHDGNFTDGLFGAFDNTLDGIGRGITVVAHVEHAFDALLAGGTVDLAIARQ